MSTVGSLLGGRLIYRQLATGHRTGIEPVLLAAAVAAQPGQAVLEAGTGAGAGLLCLAQRVALGVGVGLERDPALAALAAANIRANGFEACAVVVGDVTAAPLGRGRFDQVMANPPWFDPANTPSPDPLRRLARVAQGAGIAGWIVDLAVLLRPRGSLTMIVPASRLADMLDGYAQARLGGVQLLPLWPRAGRAAKLMIGQGRLGARGPLRMCAGLALHEGGGFSAAAERILREGAAFDWQSVGQAE